MFNFTLPKRLKKDKLAQIIDDLLDELDTGDSTTEEYAATADQLIKLAELRKKLNSTWIPSPEVLVPVLGSLLTVILVLKHEEINVITSKAFNLATRMK